MEQTFRKLQQDWEMRLLQLESFTPLAWQHCEMPHDSTQPAVDEVPGHQPGRQESCLDATYIISGET